MRILIVEGEQRLAEIVLRTLKSEGFVVDVASTAADGIHLATSSHDDLIVLDLLLPGG